MRPSLFLLCAFLSACGGGGDAYSFSEKTQAVQVSESETVSAPIPGDGREFIGPPDCVNRPELCQ